MGLFFDRYRVAHLNDALQNNGVRAMKQYAAGEHAPEAFRIARGHSWASALAGVPESVCRVSSEDPSTDGLKSSVGLEQGLGKYTSLSVEAAQIRGFHLPRVRNVRELLPPLYQLQQSTRSDFAGVSVSISRMAAP